MFYLVSYYRGCTHIVQTFAEYVSAESALALYTSCDNPCAYEIVEVDLCSKDLTT